MKKKSKIFLSIGLVIVTLFAFALVSLADIASNFESDPTYGYRYYYYSDQSKNLSVFPDRCLLDTKAWNAGTLTFTITNDLDVTVTFNFTILLRSRSDGIVPSSQLASGLDLWAKVGDISYSIDDTGSFTLSPGASVVLTVKIQTPGGGTSYNQGAVFYFTSISPDPQHIPGPIEVILNTVSGFFSSMLSSWTNLITMITSSWVFLVPVVMMVTVFMVVIIRKTVKGV